MRIARLIGLDNTCDQAHGYTLSLSLSLSLSLPLIYIAVVVKEMHAAWFVLSCKTRYGACTHSEDQPANIDQRPILQYYFQTFSSY